MEQLTAALLSCPIPASCALGSNADREGNCEVRSRPRLGCAAVSLAGLESLSSPAAATAGASSSSSTSERTPEMVQERGEGAGVHSSSMRFSSISSPINLVLQVASKPAAADHTATGMLVQPPAGGYLLQDQRRLEMLRKVLDEHNINGSTDAFYTSSSSMSVRSVSTEASSVPHTAASTEKALADMSLVSAAHAGHLFPASSLCLDSSRCSPFSSPASAASPPALSSPPLTGPLPARTATANGFFSRITRAKRCSLFSETAVAAHRVVGEERQSSPRAEAVADAAGTFPGVDSSAYVAAAAALTAASAVDVITASVGQHQQQEQRLAKIAVNGCEQPSRCSDPAQSPPAPEAAAAAVVNAALNTDHSTVAAAAAQALVEVLAETSLATADGSCVSAERISEAAAAYALLAAAGTAPEQMAAPEGSLTLGLPLQHFVSNAAEQVADNGSSGKQSEGTERTVRHRRQGGDGVVIPQPEATLSNVTSVGGETAGNGESSASLAGEKQSDFEQTSDAAANAQAAAGAALIGVYPTSAVSPRNINSAVVAPGGGVSTTVVDMPACSDTTDLDVATCCSGRSDSSPVAAATVSDSRREAFGAPPSQGERTARKKRLRDSGVAGSRKESVDCVAASAAFISPGAAATELVLKSADSKDCAVPAAAVPSENARKFLKEGGDSSGREKTAQAADATPASAAAGGGEESHSCRKKEKRSDAAGSAAAAAPLFSDMDVDKNLPSADAATASFGGETDEQRQRTKQLQRAAGGLCTLGNGEPTSQINKSAAQVSTTCCEGGGSDHVNLPGEHGTSIGREGLLDQKEGGATSAAVGAAFAVGDDARVPVNVAARKKDEEGSDVLLAAEGVPGVARRKPTHDGEAGAGGIENELCTNDVTETRGPPSSGEAQQSGGAGKTSQMSEHIGYLATTTYLSGGAAARGGAASTAGCPERSEQECSTMCCNSRNSSGELLALSGALRSSGELLALSGALRAESAQQQQGQQEQASVLQELHKKHKKEDGQEKVEQQPAEEVVSPHEGADTPENLECDAVSVGVHANNGSSRTAAPAAASGDYEGVESEESETLAERSKERSEKNALLEIENIAVSTQSRPDDTDERTALVRDKQEEEQPESPRLEALQRSHVLEQQEKKPRNQPQQQHHHHQQQQQRHLMAQQLEAKPQPDEEEDEMALQVARDCVMGGDNDMFNVSWERMGDDSGAVPPLHAYKSLSWTEGFSLPLGKIGRQKLLRQVRLKYHRNRDHWRAKLHEKGFDVTSLPRMGVEQLWAVAQQMDLFDVACIIAHEHATRRQHRGGGGGGAGLHTGAVAGQQQHHPQQATGDCDEGDGAEVAVAVAAALAAGRGATGGRGRGDGDCASVASALLSSTTGGVEAATLSHLPSLVKGGASLRTVCADKALKNALSLLADNAAAAGAMSYTACKSGQPEHAGERSRSCQQQQRLRGGGAGVNETAFLHSIGGSNGSIPGSSSITQDRCSRTRCRHKAGEPRNACAAGATDGSTAAPGRHEAAAEVATAEAEEEQDVMGEGGDEAGCKEGMYSAMLVAAGTDPTEEEEEAGADHPLLLLLQEGEAENTGQQMHEDFREDPALLLLQPPHGHTTEKVCVEEATTQEGGSEGGRKVVSRDSACGVRARKQEEAAVATEKGRRDCSIFVEGEPSGGPDGQATAAAVAAATVDTARTAGWPSRGTSRRSKKKTRQEQVPPCGGVVGELLSKVCAEALREAVASAADVSSPRYSLPSAGSSACLRALECLTEAATTDQPPRMADAPSAAASIDGVEATAAAAAAAIKRPAAEPDGDAGFEREENFRETGLQRAQVAEGLSSSCGQLRKKTWVDTEGELSAYTRQHKWVKQQEVRQAFLDTHQLESAEDEGVCSGNTEDMVRLCAAIAQHAEDRKLDSYREGCRSLAHLGPEDAEELALFLQQHFAAAASSCIAEKGAQGENGVLRVSDSDAVAFAAAGPCKEGKGWGAAGLHGQEMYEGSSSGAVPTGVIKGKQHSQRKRQREAKDRRERSSHGDSGHMRPTAVQIEETEDETSDICREMPRTAEVVQDAYSAGDDSVMGSAPRPAAAEPCIGMTRFGPASNPTVGGVARSAKEAASLAAAVDLFWMAKSISDEELKRGQGGEESMPTSLSLDKEMLDGVASTLQNEEGKIRKEVEVLAETRRCMREALTEIYLQLDNGIEEVDSPIAADKEGGHPAGAVEESVCRPLTAEAGNNKPATNTTSSAAITAGGSCAVDADATRVVEEALVPASQAPAEGSGCVNTRLERGCWGCLFPPEEPDGSTRRERRTCSQDRSDALCHLKSGSEGRGLRESVACGEGTSALRSGRDGGGQPVQKREARARGCLDAQLAERLQQRVNDLQGQLDEVKVQLHQLLKLNDAAELLSAAVLADEARQQHVFTRNALAAECGTHLDPRREDAYRSRSLIGG